MKGEYYKIYLSELAGTGIMVFIGLSIVIFNNGEGSVVVKHIPDAGVRRAITGFLFGSTGCLVTLSPVGKLSGAHINPVVSIAFWLQKKLSFGHTIGFIIAQMAGAALGASLLLVWGRQGKSIAYGATIPGPQGIAAAFIGEVVTTFLLIAGIFFFTGHQRLKNYTPFLMPALYCITVFAEGPLSGTSTNPARSFGPALISGVWTGYWLYWIAPLTGTLLAVALFRLLPLKSIQLSIAKLYHFQHDTTGFFAHSEMNT